MRFVKHKYTIVFWVLLLLLACYVVLLGSFMQARYITKNVGSIKLSNYAEKIELLFGGILADHSNILHNIARHINSGIPAHLIIKEIAEQYNSNNNFIDYIIWQDLTADKQEMVDIKTGAFWTNTIETNRYLANREQQIFDYIEYNNKPLIPVTYMTYNDQNVATSLIIALLDYDQMLEEMLSADKNRDFQFTIFVNSDTEPILTSPGYNIASIDSMGRKHRIHKTSLFSKEEHIRSSAIFRNQAISVNIILDRTKERDIFFFYFVRIITQSTLFVIAATLILWLLKGVVAVDIKGLCESIENARTGNYTRYKNILNIFNPLQYNITHLITEIQQTQNRNNKTQTLLKESEIIKNMTLTMNNDTLLKYSELRSTHNELSFTHTTLQDKYEYLKNENNKLDRLNKYKSEFLASISHEIRTPLNAVIGFAKILLEHKNLDASRQIEYINYIYDSGRYILSLAHEILGYAKTEYGVIALNEQDVNLIQIIRECIIMLESTNTQVSIITNLSPDITYMRIDAVRIKQVISNILNNAVKFSSPGQHVEIQTRLTESYIEIIVIDTGVGIAHEDIPGIFEVFGQANTEKIDSGAGIGLALSKKIAELHGGNLKLHSCVKQGTSVIIELPIFRLRRFIEESHQ